MLMCVHMYFENLFTDMSILKFAPQIKISFSAPNFCNFVSCVWVCNLSKTALAYLINYGLSKFLSSVESSRLHGPRSRRNKPKKNPNYNELQYIYI